jgi:hypothetical protein
MFPREPRDRLAGQVRRCSRVTRSTEALRDKLARVLRQALAHSSRRLSRRIRPRRFSCSSRSARQDDGHVIPVTAGCRTVPEVRRVVSRHPEGGVQLRLRSQTTVSPCDKPQFPAWRRPGLEHLGPRARSAARDIEEPHGPCGCTLPVAVPVMGRVGTGGTPLSPRFPGPASRATSSTSWKTAHHQFTARRATPGVLVHIPWDKPTRPAALERLTRASVACTSTR